MKTITILFTFIYFPFLSIAQWYVIPSPYSGNVHVIYFTNATDGYIGTNTSIIKSTDAGETWVNDNVLDFSVNGFSFVTDSYGYYGANNNIIRRTADGGDTWALQDPGISPFGVNGIAMLDEFNGAACGGFGNIVYTFSGGADWSNLSSPTTSNLNRIEFVNATTGIIVGEDGKILRSTSGGSSWGLKTSGTSSDLWDIFNIDGNTVFIAGNDGVILRSTDAGNSWNPVSSGTSADLYCICFKDAMNGYAGGYNGAMVKTTDGGTTWNIVESGQIEDIKDITYVAPRYIGIAYGGHIFTDVPFGGAAIENEPDAVSVQISPNPSSGSFTVNIPDATFFDRLIIKDINGHEVYSASLNNNPVTNISLNNPSSGLYLLYLQRADKVVVRKVLVQ